MLFKNSFIFISMRDKIKQAEYNRQYYMEHKEQLLPKIRERSNLWCKENKERRNKRDRERRLQGNHPNKDATKRHRLKRKLECISAYGGKCVCCGESHIEMLTIDHKNNNGAEHRKTFTSGGGALYNILRKLNNPSEYQCLCFNCNFSRYLGNGVCIHEREKSPKNPEISPSL